MSRLTPICCILLLISLAAPVNAELTPDFLMEADPEFHALPPAKDFKRDFKGIWLLALERPEGDYQRLAAETVARAHEHGIPDLIELAPTLQRILTAPSSIPSARFAAARALIVLESRDSAALLLEVGLKYGADLRQLVLHRCVELLDPGPQDSGGGLDLWGNHRGRTREAEARREDWGYGLEQSAQRLA
jgi:hypothetical protein